MHSWTAVDMLFQENTETHTHTHTLVYLKHMHVFAQIHKICERLEVVVRVLQRMRNVTHTEKNIEYDLKADADKDHTET